MAGDWIKMRVDLLTSPKVVRMSSALSADRFRIIGGLLSAWSLFDAHSTDGFLNGYNARTLDELIGWAGFGAAMIAVGWLIESDNGLSLPEFDTHNGAPAKRRAQESDRKRQEREATKAAAAAAAASKKTVPDMSASDADEKRTREEESRVIKNKITNINNSAGAAAEFDITRFTPCADDTDYCDCLPLDSPAELITAEFRVYHAELKTKTNAANWSRLYRGWFDKRKLPPVAGRS